MSERGTPPAGRDGDLDTRDRGRDTRAQPEEPAITNEEYDWDEFDSDVYFERNYRQLRQDDREIMRIVRDFFRDAGIVSGARGVDVGSGTNLYPALAMLPFCAELDLCEYSASNVKWLQREVHYPGPNWLDFWAVYAQREPYSLIRDPWAELRQKATVEQANVFGLPRRRWDVGTMFFVACSLSADRAEFLAAVSCFVGALKPGAPFAAAFMAKSEGYDVGDLRFPAVAVDDVDVHDCLVSVAYNVQVHLIDIGDRLRDGYGGMIVATGRVADQE